MAYEIVRVQNSTNEIFWGIPQGEKVLRLESKADSLRVFLSQDIDRLVKDALGEGRSCLWSELKILSPVTSPCQIICLGKNYLDHMLETGVKPKDKDFNIMFTKADSSLAPPTGGIVKPSKVNLLDYEIEMGLVIKRDITHPIMNEKLEDLISGVVMANDISARDIQVPERQWFKGKSFRGFCPVGPLLCLLNHEEMAYLNNLDLELKVNGKVRQKSNTSLLIHSPMETLREISQIFDLRAGDLILTGTPGGVAMKVKPKSWWQEIFSSLKSDKEKSALFVKEQLKSPRYLKPGDLVESTIKSPDGKINLGKQELMVLEN